MKEFESKLINSYILHRRDEEIFQLTDGGILANLDGYVIMPYEKFNALVDEKHQFVPEEQPCTEQTK